jgi:hypothetical protein
VKRNFSVLAARQGTTFRNYFAAGFMRHFSDAARAEEIAGFAPANATAGGRSAAARAAETIRLDADLKTRALPVIDDWIKKHSRD